MEYLAGTEYKTQKEKVTTPTMELVAAFLTLGDEVKFERSPSDLSTSKHVTMVVTGYGLYHIQSEWERGTIEGNLMVFANNLRQVKSFIHSCQAQTPSHGGNGNGRQW